MPLNDPVPSSAFDVLERNAQDTDKFVNGVEAFTNRTGKSIRPIPLVSDEVESNAAAVDAASTQALNVSIPEAINALGLQYPPITYTGGLTLDSYTKTYEQGGAIYLWGGELGTVTTGSFDEGEWQPLQGDLQLRRDIAQMDSTALLVSGSYPYYGAGKVANTLGRASSGDGLSAQWLATSTTGLTASQTPESRGDGTLVDGSGRLWELVGGVAGFNIQANVPSRFATMQDAVEFFHNKVRFADGYGLDIYIETGHQPSVGLSVANGDYGYISVSSEDAQVTAASGFGQGNSFIEGDNAVMPVLNTIVDGNSGELGKGYRCENGSRGYVNAGCGAINCWQDGLVVRYDARCYAEGGVFTGNAINGTTSSGIICWAGILHADGADVSNSGYYGAQAAHGGILSFKSGTANNCFRYGIRATDAAMVDADGATANDCGVYGAYAFNGCILNFRSGTATGSGTANVAVLGSLAELGDAVLTGSLGDGVLASGSTIRANSVDVSGAAGVGANITGTTGNMQSLNADNCNDGIFVDEASTLHIGSADASNCTLRGLRVENGSTVNADSVTADDCGQYGVRAYYGSRVNAVSGNFRRAGTFGIYAFSGSHINARNADGRTVDGADNSDDIVVQEGSTINAGGATGGLSQTANTVTAEGIIYQ